LYGGNAIHPTKVSKTVNSASIRLPGRAYPMGKCSKSATKSNFGDVGHRTYNVITGRYDSGFGPQQQGGAERPRSSSLTRATVAEWLGLFSFARNKRTPVEVDRPGPLQPLLTLGSST
jgi:hypothetical protein